MRLVVLVAYVLAIICAIAAIIYITTQAGSLPTFIPGYTAGSTRIHSTHALAAAIAPVVLYRGEFMSARMSCSMATKSCLIAPQWLRLARVPKRTVNAVPRPQTISTAR
jgi:hypothetical protein